MRKIFMARHQLTKEEQQKGTQHALESPKTPPQLKKGLKKRQQQLQGSAAGNTNAHKRNSGASEKTSRESKDSDDRSEE
jgi:hypothetical protein